MAEAVKTFLVPKIGTGTRADPFRPKYLMVQDVVRGLVPLGKCSLSDAGDFYLVDWFDDEKVIESVLAQRDAQAIDNSGRVLDQAEADKASEFYAGKLAVSGKATGAELVTELRTAIKVKQSIRFFTPAERTELAARVAAQVAIEA